MLNLCRDALSSDLSSHELYQAFAYGQAQPCAVKLADYGDHYLAEGQEEQVHLLLWDADACIRDFKAELMRIVPQVLRGDGYGYLVLIGLLYFHEIPLHFLRCHYPRLVLLT
jgi:hypothetical protein